MSPAAGNARVFISRTRCVAEWSYPEWHTPLRTVKEYPMTIQLSAVTSIVYLPDTLS